MKHFMNLLVASLGLTMSISVGSGMDESHKIILSPQEIIASDINCVVEERYKTAVIGLKQHLDKGTETEKKQKYQTLPTALEKLLSEDLTQLRFNQQRADEIVKYCYHDNVKKYTPGFNALFSILLLEPVAFLSYREIVWGGNDSIDHFFQMLERMEDNFKVGEVGEAERKGNALSTFDSAFQSTKEMILAADYKFNNCYDVVRVLQEKTQLYLGKLYLDCCLNTILTMHTFGIASTSTEYMYIFRGLGSFIIAFTHGSEEAFKRIKHLLNSNPNNFIYSVYYKMLLKLLKNHNQPAQQLFNRMCYESVLAYEYFKNHVVYPSLNEGKDFIKLEDHERMSLYNAILSDFMDYAEQRKASTTHTTTELSPFLQKYQIDRVDKHSSVPLSSTLGAGSIDERLTPKQQFDKAMELYGKDPNKALDYFTELSKRDSIKKKAALSELAKIRKSNAYKNAEKRPSNDIGYHLFKRDKAEKATIQTKPTVSMGKNTQATSVSSKSPNNTSSSSQPKTRPTLNTTNKMSTSTTSSTSSNAVNSFEKMVKDAQARANCQQGLMHLQQIIDKLQQDGSNQDGSLKDGQLDMVQRSMQSILGCVQQASESGLREAEELVQLAEQGLGKLAQLQQRSSQGASSLAIKPVESQSSTSQVIDSPQQKKKRKKPNIDLTLPSSKSAKKKLGDHSREEAATSLEAIVPSDKRDSKQIAGQAPIINEDAELKVPIQESIERPMQRRKKKLRNREIDTFQVADQSQEESTIVSNLQITPSQLLDQSKPESGESANIKTTFLEMTKISRTLHTKKSSHKGSTKKLQRTTSYNSLLSPSLDTFNKSSVIEEGTTASETDKESLTRRKTLTRSKTIQGLPKVSDDFFDVPIKKKAEKKKIKTANEIDIKDYLRKDKKQARHKSEKLLVPQDEGANDMSSHSDSRSSTESESSAITYKKLIKELSKRDVRKKTDVRLSEAVIESTLEELKAQNKLDYHWKGNTISITKSGDSGQKTHKTIHTHDCSDRPWNAKPEVVKDILEISSECDEDLKREIDNLGNK